MRIESLLERGIVPDPLLRLGIRRMLKSRLEEEAAADAEETARRRARLAERMRASPIALSTEAANVQHYEVPPEFFRLVLGARLKYSSCLFPEGVENLDRAEEAMLALTCERAQIAEGHEVLELGCGWGSLTLWMAERYPGARITAVSNSRHQRAFIEGEARRRGLSNVAVVTADMNSFFASATYDRVVSVEMFEHMRNWPRLLERIASWMRRDARLFLHVFSHRAVAYPFEDRGAADWMARQFFTGGLMPSDDLLLDFSEHVEVEERWRVSGLHYARTAEAWLANLDRRRVKVLELFSRAEGPAAARRRYNAWRVFFLACAELFGYRGGSEWIVSHYRLKRRGAGP
jgi:cyclopropane-fatty-acyl-phospholipid synthase